MSVTKANADVLDLTDAYAFSGTVTGAGTSGGYEFVSAVTASDSATVAFTGFEAGYDYQIEFLNIIAQTDSVNLFGQVGTGGTPTYQTASYRGSDYRVSDTGAIAGSKITSSWRASSQTQGNGASEDGYGTLTIFDPMTVADTFIHGSGFHIDAQGTPIGANWTSKYSRQVAEAVTAFKLYYSSGNIVSGLFKLYRRPNA